MEFHWTGHDREAWDVAHGAAGAALQQDWAYGDAMAKLGATIARARVTRDGETVALAQVTMRRFGGFFHGAACLMGPVWTQPLTPFEKTAVYAGLKRSAPFSRPRVLVFQPNEPGPPAPGVERMRRVMTGISTVRLDLSQDEAALRAAMEPKWRNRLAAAERAGLRIGPNGAKPGQYQWLLEREAAQRVAKRYKALPERFVELFQAAKHDKRASVFTVRADLGREAAAAMMFLIHGQAASYHIGWAGEEGRKRGAHNLLLWRAISTLREAGVRTLDLGGVDTSTHSAGLARFKIGTGGQVVTLAGTYL